MTRVVLDTNVVLSALLFGQGRLAWLRQAWRNERVHPLIARDTAAELLRVLACPKFRLSGPECEELLADYLPWCEVVSVPHPPPPVPRCRDPDDAMFLALALAGRADHLVTGDADLLALASRFTISIISPEVLRASLEPGRR